MGAHDSIRSDDHSEIGAAQFHHLDLGQIAIAPPIMTDWILLLAREQAHREPTARDDEKGDKEA